MVNSHPVSPVQSSSHVFYILIWCKICNTEYSFSLSACWYEWPNNKRRRKSGQENISLRALLLCQVLLFLQTCNHTALYGLRDPAGGIERILRGWEGGKGLEVLGGAVCRSVSQGCRPAPLVIEISYGRLSAMWLRGDFYGGLRASRCGRGEITLPALPTPAIRLRYGTGRACIERDEIKKNSSGNMKRVMPTPVYLWSVAKKCMFLFQDS